MNPDSKPYPADGRWYYADGENAVGPLPFSSLLALQQAGVLTGESLITPEGTEDWKPLRDYLAAVSAGSPGVGVPYEEPPQDGGAAQNSSASSTSPASPVRPLTKEERKAAWAGCTFLVLLVFAICGLLTKCFDDDEDESPILTGITYNQILSNGLGQYFKMEKSSNVDGRPRYIGQTNPSAAILEIQGNKSDIHSASLMIGMTTDSQETNLKNTLLAMRFLANADRTWKDESRNDWLESAIRQIADEGEKKISLERGRLRFTVAEARPFGYSLSVHSKSSK